MADEWDPFADPADAAVAEGADSGTGKIPPPAAASSNSESRNGSDDAKVSRPSRTVGKDFDPYALLGIPHDATDAAIRSAFRKVSLRVHPDHCPDDPEAAAKFRELMETRDFLLNPFRRRLYNLRHGLAQKTQIILWWSSWEEIFEEADAPDDDDGDGALAPAPPPAPSAPAGGGRTDVLILGATGLIGTLACSWARRRARGLTWAVAGRDGRKLGLVAEKFGGGPLFRGAHRAESPEDVERLVRTARVVVDFRPPLAPCRALRQPAEEEALAIAGPCGVVGVRRDAPSRLCPSEVRSGSARRVRGPRRRLGGVGGVGGSGPLADPPHLRRAPASKAAVAGPHRGPKYQIGYDVAEACIRGGAHYIDTSGEPIGCLAAAAVRDELDRKAKAAKVSLVFFCGSFTLPRDLGCWAMVEYLFDRHQLPTRRVNVYQKTVGQTIPGTYLSSFVKGPNPTEAKKSGAPFPLGGVRGGSVRPEDDPGKGIEEDANSGLWVQIDTDDYVAWVLRCSCGLFDSSRPYGDSFWVKCWNLLPDKQAGESAAMNNAFVKRAYAKYLSEGKLPPPGSGPKEDLRRQSFITNVFVAEAETADESEPVVAYAVMTEGPGGPGDPCEGTAVLALEAARCLLDAAGSRGSGALHCGFGTPAYHLGHLGFLDRMSQLGYTWNVVDGVPPKELFRNILGSVAPIMS